MANLPAAKAEKPAEALTDAVAPVVIKVGGCGESLTASRSRGSVFCAKLKNASLWKMGINLRQLKEKEPLTLFYQSCFGTRLVAVPGKASS